MVTVLTIMEKTYLYQSYILQFQIQMRCCDLKQAIHPLKPFKCDWIKTFPKKKRGLKFHCQLLQTLDGIRLAQPVIRLRGQLFFHVLADVSFGSYFPLINDEIIWKLPLCISSVYLCLILIIFAWWSKGHLCGENAKPEEMWEEIERKCCQ